MDRVVNTCDMVTPVLAIVIGAAAGIAVGIVIIAILAEGFDCRLVQL